MEDYSEVKELFKKYKDLKRYLGLPESELVDINKIKENLGRMGFTENNLEKNIQRFVNRKKLSEIEKKIYIFFNTPPRTLDENLKRPMDF